MQLKKESFVKEGEYVIDFKGTSGSLKRLREFINKVIVINKPKKKAKSK